MAIFNFKKKWTDQKDVNTSVSKASNFNKTLIKERDDSIKVSVIIPVYNAMPYLSELLNSLELQDLDSKAYEVIAVNDGSTDYGNEILDTYAKRNENFRVVHQENSGWPGRPRNVGIDEARGEYVFFCDADDVLGHEALRRMCAYADENDVDILVPKMVGIGGRRVQASLFTKNRKDASIDFILRTLSPQKMIRRSLMNDNRIRFREDKVRLEDGMAMVQGYVVARRISILSDYDYYQIRTRADGQNISVRPIDPAGYVESLGNIAATLSEHFMDEPRKAQELIAGVFNRKGLRFYQGSRFLNYSDSYKQEWVKAHQQFLSTFLTVDLSELLPERAAQKASLIRAGDLEGLRRLAIEESEDSRAPELRHMSADSKRVTLEIQVFSGKQIPVSIFVEDRNSKRSADFQLVPGSEAGCYRAELEIDRLDATITKLGDLHVLFGAVTSKKRTLFPESVPELQQDGLRVYRTANGFVSVDLRARKVTR